MIGTTAFFCKNDHFELVKATKQYWAGGTAASGNGHYFELELKVNHGSDILFIDQLWIGDEYFPVKASKPFPAQAKDGFGKEDMVVISVNKYINRGMHEEEQVGVTKITPPEYEGAAMISYLYKDKRKQFIIKGFEEKEALNYP